jgi:preprotein translocase subunit SecA
MKDDILDLLEDFAHGLVGKFYDEGDLQGLQNEARTHLLADLPLTLERFQQLGADGVKAEIVRAATEFYKRKEEKLGSELMASLEKMVVLQVIDEKWKDHLREMDDLKEGIHLRAYGQKDPIVEYKTEAFRMFMELLNIVNSEILTTVFRLFPAPSQQLPIRGPQRPQQIRMSHDSSLGMGFQANKEPIPGAAGQQTPAGARHQGPAGPPQKPQPVQVGEKIGRNDPCPCGSGKKYKQCHGR